MKKVILGLMLIIVIAIAGSVYYLLTNLDALVEAAIEKYGSEATQTSVLVDSVKINLTDGAAGITGLTIGNPAGYDLPNAFSLAEIRAATAGGDKHTVVFPVEITDEEGAVVAKIDKGIYIRLRRELRPAVTG